MATVCFEIELSVTGSVEEDDPEVNYYGGVEGAEIEDIGVVEVGPSGTGVNRFTTKSILDGVDMKNPEIQKLLSNILALKQDEIDEAIYQEACE